MKGISKTIKIFGVILFYCCFSCVNSNVKEHKDNFKLQDKFEYVHLIPDSIRTPEQRKLYKLILKTTVQHLKVKENHVYLDLSQKEFLDKGIPRQYYDLLMHDLKSLNNFIDSTKLENVDSILKESYKELYQEFRNE